MFLTWAAPVSGVGRVFLQRFDDGGAVFPTPLTLETEVASAANNPAVAMAGPGILLVVWEQDNRIVGQRLTVDGRALERPTILSTPSDAAASQAMPALATTSDGGAAVVWSNTGGSAIDVALRQMRHCGNGNVDPGEQCDDGNADRRGLLLARRASSSPTGRRATTAASARCNCACSQGACVGGTFRLVRRRQRLHGRPLRRADRAVRVTTPRC